MTTTVQAGLERNWPAVLHRAGRGSEGILEALHPECPLEPWAPSASQPGGSGAHYLWREPVSCLNPSIRSMASSSRPHHDVYPPGIVRDQVWACWYRCVRTWP